VWIALPWLPAHVSLFVLLFPANALRVNRSLQTLCVGDAAFGDESCAALCDGLLENEGVCSLLQRACGAVVTAPLSRCRQASWRSI
jgi:hypothetical protein